MIDKATLRRGARSARSAAFGLLNAPDALGASYRGTDKFQHGYLSHYRSHLGADRFRRMVVYEIGVGGYDDPSTGGSLAMWRDYFNRSVIVGLDISAKRINFGPRVFFEQADQNSPADLQRVVDRYGMPDVVIDDGSHIGQHIHTSFEVLWPQLRDGGTYVIEDLSTSYYPEFGGHDPAPPTSGIGLIQSLLADVEARDPTFEMRPDWGKKPTPAHRGIAAVHMYPGIAFVQKASR